MIWVKKEIDALKVKQLAESFGIDIVLAAILVRRGITEPDDIKFYLEDDTRFLHNPFLFKDMVRAVERIRQAIEAGEKILIYGDRDVDGITATVLLYEALSSHGAQVLWKVPLGDDDYGLSLKDVEEALTKGVTLLCTVDCGISNIKEIAFARTRGIDVIVVDHHNPQAERPDAYAIINPKVEGSGYPFAFLSGCGVAGKLDWALAFSHGPYYRRPMTLLHITPQNESFLIEARRLDNLVDAGSFRENVVPALGKSVLGKWQTFAAGSEIHVYALGEQKKLFEKTFGSMPDGAALIDFQPLLDEGFPQLAGKSLLAIREMSRLGKYGAKPLSEIELFKNLFVSTALKACKDLLAGVWRRLDLAALGTIADLMPLKNENRIIVRQGLKQMVACERNGLRELLTRKNLLGKEISVKDIAWQVSPIINATGRLGEPDKAVELFLASDREELDDLAFYIVKLNERRKELGDITWNKMFDAAQDSFRATEGKFVLVTGASIHRGITGILATKMVRHFKAPVCVVAELSGKAVGSVRSVPEFPLTDWLSNFRDIFTDFGGHDLAAGFNLPLGRLDAFRSKFYDVVRTLGSLPEKEDHLDIDAEIPKHLLTPDLYNIVTRLAPYGEGHQPLTFFTSDLGVTACDAVGKKDQVHLKLLLDTGTFKFPSMLWNGIDLYGERLKAGQRVDAVYRMNKNVYMNTETLQLIITDIMPGGEKKITLLRPDEAFFDSNRHTEL
jgi:single-stranded-DNA-specific exonuclease